MKNGWGLTQNEDGSIGSVDDSSENEENLDEIIKLEGNYESEEEEVTEETLTEEDSEESQEESDEVIEEGSKDNPFQTIFQQLVDNDVIDYDEEKEFTGTPEEIIESLKDKAKKETENSFEEMLSSLPKENAEIIRAIKSGASLEEAYELSQEVDYESVDLNDVNNQANIVGAHMESLGLSHSSIERKIKALHKAGLLEDEAKEAQEKLVNNQRESKKEKLSRIEKEREESVLREQKEAEEFKDQLLSKKEIAGFKITNNEAKNLYDFITKVDEEGKTGLDKKDNDDSRLLYAYFVMKGMDKNALTKDIKKSESFKLKKKLDEKGDKLSKLKNSPNSGGTNDDEFVSISEISSPFSK